MRPLLGRRIIQRLLLVAFPLWCGGSEQLASTTTNPTPRYTLIQCVNLVLERNLEVQAARKRIQEAGGAVIEARAGYLPGVTASGNYLRVETDYINLGGALPNRRPELWNVALRVTENLYSGGAVGGRMQIARLNESSRLLDFEATLDRVILETRLAFYGILRDRAAIPVHEEAVSVLEKELQSQRHRVDLGSGDRLTALRAEVSLSLERAAMLEAENQLGNAYVRLGELLALPVSSRPGAGLDPGFDIIGELAFDAQSFELNVCLAKALELRPEMRIRANDMAVQQQQLVVDRSGSRPRVDAFAGYDVVNEPNVAAPRTYYNGYLAGISISWPWFDGFLTRGKMTATRERISQAELARETMQNTIEAEVVRAVHDLEVAGQIIKTQRKNVALAEETLRLAGSNLELGITTQLDLLQSRVDLTRARTTELGARFAWNAALARLQRAVSSKFTIIRSGQNSPARPAP